MLMGPGHGILFTLADEDAATPFCSHLHQQHAHARSMAPSPLSMRTRPSGGSSTRWPARRRRSSPYHRPGHGAGGFTASAPKPKALGLGDDVAGSAACAFEEVYFLHLSIFYFLCGELDLCVTQNMF
jgi:hypothetical protein